MTAAGAELAAGGGNLMRKRRTGATGFGGEDLLTEFSPQFQESTPYRSSGQRSTNRFLVRFLMGDSVGKMHKEAGVSLAKSWAAGTARCAVAQASKS